MQILLTSIFNAIKLGTTYAVVAIALVLIFKATTLINFAQGELAMLGAFLAYVLIEQQGWPIPLAILVAMIATAVLGVVIERLLIRPFDPTDHLPVVLITLGIFLIINAIAGDIWNYESRAFPSMFRTFPEWLPGVGGERFIEIGGARLFYDTIGLLLVMAVAVLGLFALLNRTKVGLAFRAVSSNTESARLVGINTGRTLGFGWALACAFGTLGAALVAPTLNLSPNMMATVLIYALAAASFGGLDSLGGAILGGFVVGFVQSVIVSWFFVIQLDQTWMAILQLTFAFIVILVVLLVRPAGMFGTKMIERV